MSNVTLNIAGRRYTVACDAGEEEHIAMLGRSINGKLVAIPNLGNQSEQRTLLFAALLLADELHEANKAVTAPAPAAAPAPEMAKPLENLAERLESLASQLEASLPSS